MKESLTFTRAGLRELDRRAIEEFRIPILLLMENAGRAVAEAALRRMPKGANVLVLAGPGNNGGDGFAAARHLHNAGRHVTVLLLAERTAYHDAAGAQLAIIEAMSLPIEKFTGTGLRDWLVDVSPEDVIIDGLFGTGLSRPVKGLAAEAIHAANASGHPIIAIDIPSGLDADTGEPVSAGGPVIQAVETVSFCGSKAGFARAKSFTGKVMVADIGAPRELLESLAVRPSGV